MDNASTTTQPTDDRGRAIIEVTGTMVSRDVRESPKVEGGRYVHSRFEGAIPGTKLTSFTGMAFEGEPIEAMMAIDAGSPSPVAIRGVWMRNTLKILGISPSAPQLAKPASDADIRNAWRA